VGRTTSTTSINGLILTWKKGVGGGNTAVAAREVTEVGFNANKSVG